MGKGVSVEDVPLGSEQFSGDRTDRLIEAALTANSALLSAVEEMHRAAAQMSSARAEIERLQVTVRGLPAVAAVQESRAEWVSLRELVGSNMLIAGEGFDSAGRVGQVPVSIPDVKVLVRECPVPVEQPPKNSHDG